MGSENLHYRRKSKSNRELTRRHAKRQPYAKILIVCEGTKTEPNYFLELRNHYRLDSTTIKISGECGSSPISVIKHAQELYKRSREANDPFDQVYCVIDKDCHQSYNSAISKLGKFILINSVPCFEYWLLMHFKYTTAPYYSLPKKSSADHVLSDLKIFLPKYSKGCPGVFIHLLDKLKQAIQNSKKALETAEANQTDMPSTRVHILIEFLQDLAAQKEKQFKDF